MGRAEKGFFRNSLILLSILMDVLGSESQMQKNSNPQGQLTEVP